MREDVASAGILVCMMLSGYYSLGTVLMWPSVYRPGVKLMSVAVPGIPSIPTTPGTVHVTAHGKFRELSNGEVLVRSRMDRVFRLDFDGVITWGAHGAAVDIRLSPIVMAIFAISLTILALLVSPEERVAVAAFYAIALPVNLLFCRTLGKAWMLILLREYVEGRSHSMTRLTRVSSGSAHES